MGSCSGVAEVVEEVGKRFIVDTFKIRRQRWKL